MPRTTTDPKPSTVAFRLPAEVAERLRAGAVGQTLSEHLRGRILDLMSPSPVSPDAGRGRRVTSADRAALARAAGALGKVGGNLNQLSRAANEARQRGLNVSPALFDRLADELEAIGAARLALVRAATPWAGKPSVELGGRIVPKVPAKGVRK